MAEEITRYDRRANNLGALGDEARKIQEEVARKNIEEQRKAQETMIGARTTQRNLGARSIEEGDAAAVDVMPGLGAGNAPLGRRETATTSTTDSTTEETSGSEGDGYEGKTNDELRAEADSRNLDVRSDAKKADLVKALREDDRKADA